MFLPDYTKSKKWIELRQKMGVKTIKPFKGPSYKKKTFKKAHAKLSKGVKVASKKEYDKLINKVDSTFEDADGRKLTVYIKEPSIFKNRSYGNYTVQNTSKEYLPKYHITNCQTLQGMRKAKRFNLRYVYTHRTDGLFPILDPISKKEEEVVLKVCMHCLGLMKKMYPIDSIFAGNRNVFSITDYFEKYSETESSLLNQLPNTYSKDYTPQPRSKNWSQKSISYREKQNWTCEICNVCYKNNRRLLHTHHKDGNKSNDNENNLKALCQDCHNTQPGHSKWKTSNAEYHPKESVKTKQKPLNMNLIKKGYKKRELSTEDAIKMGECQTVEFKRTLLAGKKPKSNIAKSMVFNIFKSIAAFLNTDGGKLIIGVDDNGNIKGIQEIGNQFKSYDDMDLYFGNTFNYFLQSHLRENCKWRQEIINGKNVFVINVQKCTLEPVEIFPTKHEKLKIDGETVKLTLPIPSADTEIIIRSGAQKVTLTTPQSVLKFARKRFPKWYKLMYG